MGVSVLVSDVNGFRVEEIKADLEALQGVVGGYIEAVDSGGDWHLYCDEEGKLTGKKINTYSTAYLDLLFTEAGRAPFSSRDVLVGSIVWLGNDKHGGEQSLPIEHVFRFTANVLATWDSALPITVVRYRKEIWVYDQRNVNIAVTVRDCAEAARESVSRGNDHGVIEVYPGLTKGRWEEIRVDIMDDYTITLHDERTDRSYG